MVDSIARAMPWALQAACRDIDGMVWVNDPSGEKNAPKQTSERLAICGGCPVRVECLRYSLQAPFGETFGTWGGTSQLERRSFSWTLSTFRQGRDDERKGAAVEEIVSFFERTHRQRLAHWRRLAKETTKLPPGSPNRTNVPAARARPPIVAAAGQEMARRLDEEREQARIATAGANWHKRA
jgi:WhiB family redox-sensing transcriptional regulator